VRCKAKGEAKQNWHHTVRESPQAASHIRVVPGAWATIDRLCGRG
jgi:hypothetical protein